MSDESALTRLVHWLTASQYANLSDTDVLRCLTAPEVDWDALRALMARYGRRVYTHGLHATGSPELADDVFQETFVALARSAQSIRSGVALRKWLDTTACRLGQRLRRRESRRKSVETRAAVANVKRAGDVDAKAEIVRAVLRAVAGLPEQYRAAITTHYLNGESVAATAKELGLSDAGAKSRIHRALEMLREALERGGHGPAAAVATTVIAESAEASPALIAATLHAAKVAPPALGAGAMLLAWIGGHKKVATAVLLAVVATGGYGAYLASRPAPPPALPVVALPPPETIRQRNSRVLHATVLPEVVQALKPMVLGGEKPRVVSVVEREFQFVVDLEADHKLLKKTLFTSHLRLTYDERYGALVADIDWGGSGASKRVKLDAPVLVGEGGAATKVNLDSAQAMCRAFQRLTTDPPPPISPKAVAEGRINAADVEYYGRIVGTWYSQGKRFLPAYVYVADDGRAILMDEYLGHKLAITVPRVQDGDPDQYAFDNGHLFRLVDGGKRLVAGPNAYMLREPNTEPPPRFDKWQ